jgi:hypothetical protein
MKVYLASPWFNAEQEERRLRVLNMLVSEGLDVFSPKDDMLFKPGETTPLQVVDANCDAIEECDAIVVITDGKDVGTMFEAGYAYSLHAVGANPQFILYLWEGGAALDPGKFNLMLGATGQVFTDVETLRGVIRGLKETGEYEADVGVIPDDQLE